MKVIVARPRGFCAGVNMAIACVEKVLDMLGPPVYVYHEIVHNRHVVAGFASRGVVFVDDVAQVPRGAVVVYSAHGVSPEVRRRTRERGLVEIDATCPLVTKVHLEVLRFVREGRKVIFIGHRSHDEAVGTVGEAPESIIVVENELDVASLDLPAGLPLAYVTQTTLSVADTGRIVAALKARWPGIVGPASGDICYATTNRQRAVATLCREADAVLVIGSRNSSNSRRLVETAAACGTRAYLIDDASELRDEWFAGVRTVLVTAGASAPERLVQDLLQTLAARFGGEVEERAVAEENVSFALPQCLESLQRRRPPADSG